MYSINKIVIVKKNWFPFDINQIYKYWAIDINMKNVAMQLQIIYAAMHKCSDFMLYGRDLKVLKNYSF